MATQERGVSVIEQSTSDSLVEWSLDGFPTNQFNRLIPTQTLSLANDLLRPIPQVVVLSPDEKAGDVYHSNDMPDGHAAPTKVGLRKLATAAGISFVDERRTDDGSDPNVIEVTCTAVMMLPTGVPLRAVGTKRVDLEAQVWRSPQHRAKFKSFLMEHVASRAQNRAIRGLLSLKGSYPLSTYEKPFVVITYGPNMAHPEVRARVLDAIAPSVGAVYGPGNGQKALASGKPIDVTPAPEEDPAPATPPALPGEKLAKAELTTDEPDWLAKGAAAKPDLAATIRSYATSSGMRGKAKDPQLERLQGGVFEGIERAKIGQGIELLFGPEARQELRATEANALIVAHESFADQETWAAAWTAMVDASASAAA